MKRLKFVPDDIKQTEIDKIVLSYDDYQKALKNEDGMSLISSELTSWIKTKSAYIPYEFFSGLSDYLLENVFKEDADFRVGYMFKLLLHNTIDEAIFTLVTEESSGGKCEIVEDYD